jgi:hypothetical protein
MFKITIEGETLSDLASNVLTMAAQFQTTAPEEEKPAKRKAKAKATPAPAPEGEDEDLGADLEAELNAPVEPMPATGAGIVDGGTGQPIPKGDTIQMTFDDVKVAAAKLAAKDTPALGKILKKYGAANLSGVAKDKLGDFAADVMEALG